MKFGHKDKKKEHARLKPEKMVKKKIKKKERCASIRKKKRPIFKRTKTINN